MLEARGVEPPGVREMVEDFEDQARLNPRLKQNVGHISLSFSPEDAPKLTDERMTQIALEYMQKMGIDDTQYLLVRHLDQPHPHCHLVYNRVGDHGQTISDRNIKLRSAGSIPLPPFDSPFALSPEMMQRREGESPEKHIALITALINKAAEAMAIALMERKRRMEARSRKIG